VIQFLGVKWQDGCHQILTEVIIKITPMSPLATGQVIAQVAGPYQLSEDFSSLQWWA